MKGSLRHVMDLITSPEFPSIMNGLLEGTGAVLSNPDCRCPKGLENPTDSAEAQLEDYLVAHRHPSGVVIDPEWWFPYKTNRNRRPVWDLLCHVLIDGTPGLLLVESKAHIAELEERDKKKPPNRESARSRANDYSIRLRLAEASLKLGDLGIGRFRLSADTHYQLSNRLAYLSKLSESGVPTILMYLGRLASPDWPHDPFRDGERWRKVVMDHMSAVAPTGFLERPFGTVRGGLMHMIVRSLKST